MGEFYVTVQFMTAVGHVNYYAVFPWVIGLVPVHIPSWPAVMSLPDPAYNGAIKHGTDADERWGRDPSRRPAFQTADPTTGSWQIHLLNWQERSDGSIQNRIGCPLPQPCQRSR